MALALEEAAGDVCLGERLVSSGGVSKTQIF